MTVQIVEIAGRKMAMLPVDDYERLLDIVEDKADALAAIQAEQRRHNGEEYLPAELVDRIMAGESPLKVWRNHRGMTLAAADSHKSMLSEIENRKRLGTPQLLRRLAHALNVTVDDILPVD